MPQNYPKTFGMGSTLLPFFGKCPKESPKNTTPKIFGFIRVDPPPPFGQCPNVSGFLFGMSSLTYPEMTDRYSTIRIPNTRDTESLNVCG